MTVSLEDFYHSDGRVSECCGMPALGEIVNNTGICSQCREWTGFEEREEDESQD